MASINGMLLAFLHLVLVSSVSAKVFLSIDCGSSAATYTDDKNITWSPDVGYVNSGKSRDVPYMYSSPSIKEMNTLRVFQTGEKNCYTINVDRGEQVLVRATFYYGNYDGAYLGPTFDIHLNGEYWGTVVGYVSYSSYHEAIIVADGGVINVCLVQRHALHYPFISALELRSLDSGMYARANSSSAMYLHTRIMFSDSKAVRYPDDVYDRTWRSSTLTPTITGGKNLTIGVDHLKDKPPAAALRGAYTGYSTSAPLSLELGQYLPMRAIPVFIKMYFVELKQLNAMSQKRSFDVYMDSKRLTSTPISPSYGIASEWTFINSRASSGTVFYLKATSDSTLPPIINALELYTFNDEWIDSNSPGGIGNGNGSEGRCAYSPWKLIIIPLVLYLYLIID